MSASKKMVRRTRAEAYARWVSALRNGKRKQATGTLRETEFRNGKVKVIGFCCLGVACDLARVDGGSVWDGGEFMGNSGELPEPIQKFLGMNGDQMQKLIDMNDSEFKSFKEIATYIEKYVAPRNCRSHKKQVTA